MLLLLLLKTTYLNQLKVKLIDVHSQHQTMQLSDANFQFSILDALAKNDQKIASYQRGLKQLNVYRKELQALEAQQREANQQYDYNLHLYNELVESKLKEDEQTDLEERIEKLNNVEDIKLNLSEALTLGVGDEVGIQNLLNSVENNLQKIAPFSKEYEELALELATNPIKLQKLRERLQENTKITSIFDIALYTGNL